MGNRASWLNRQPSLTASLVAATSSDPWGDISPSVYETARLVAFAPWLAGHSERIDFLLNGQRPDGGWGGDDGYRLVPTLSATEALLRTLTRDGTVDRGRVAAAVDRALGMLFDQLNNGRATAIPDTVAVELLIPALVNDINAHLTGPARLVAPDGTDPDTLARLSEVVRQGRNLPMTLLHSLEGFGVLAHGLRSVARLGGAVGCSPAATAAWLGAETPSAEHHESVAYLAAVQGRHGGPAPVCAPVPVFERAWVVVTLVSAGVPVAVPAELLAGLGNAFGEFGVAAGLGLPADADDTATALCALARTGHPRSPDCLWAYRANDHFSSFPGERTWSTTTNAHVLQAFDMCLDHGREPRRRYLDTIAGLADWLCECQEPEGSWTDKWHASPYYATAACVTALTGQTSPAAGVALRRALAWLLETQRGDGSWGRWTGTPEETAYAVRILLTTSGEPTDTARRAVARGCAFLLRSHDREHPPLWHDKDLYTPRRIVEAEITAALWLAHQDERVMAMLDLDGEGKAG